MQEESVTAGNQTILFDASAIDDTSPQDLFASLPERVAGSNQLGRGTVSFIDRGDRQWVLRQYRRGGLIGRLVKTRYLFLGIDRTRMAQEFRLLSALFAQGMPVPRPVAVQIVRTGVSYQGALITERLAARKTLAETLIENALEPAQWQSVGACIGHFHHSGVFHADLNANNIMLHEQSVFLIDFDRGRFRNPAEGNWPRSNLDRLLRSLRKIKGKNPELHFSEGDWQALEAGYRESRDRL